MARRRNDERPPEVPVDPDGNVITEPERNGEATKPTPTLPPADSKPTGPVAGFAANSDRTTRLEIAVWSKQVRAEGEEYTQFSLTLSRAWRATDGKWHESNAYRAHDVPVLLYLIQQAHNWCVEQRMVCRTNPSERLPF